MKILGETKALIEKPDGYKNQFVVNEKRNILFVDPIMSNHDYYTMIFPALALNNYELANVAFTNIRKYSDIESRDILELSDNELAWAHTIVFPFSVTEFHFQGKHLFDSIRELNPSIRIVLIIEDDFTTIQFSEKLAKYFQIQGSKGSLPEINDTICKYICSNISRSDLVLVHGAGLGQSLFDYLTKMNIQVPIKAVPLMNHYELVREGILPEITVHPFRDPDQVKVLIDVLDYKLASRFIGDFVEKCPENVLFYSKHEFNSPRVNLIKNSSPTNDYKRLFTHNFDYHLLLSENNPFTRSNFFMGKFIDSALFGCIPITINQSFYDGVIKKEDPAGLFVFIEKKQLLKKLQNDNLADRVEMGNKVFERSKYHQISPDQAILYFDTFFSIET